MFNHSPRFLLSPRFLALPLIAFAIIVALAQVSKNTSTAGTQVASQKIYRAINCANPANSGNPTCTVAADPKASSVR